MKGLQNSARAAAVILALAAVGALLWFFPVSTSRENLSAFPKLTDVQLAGRTIVDFGTNQDGTMTYTYLAEPVPALLAEREVPELRTENSYTQFEGVVGEGENQEIKLTSVFYAQPTYAQDVDGSWRYLEYATTSEQSFRNRDLSLWSHLVELVVRTAYADSISPFAEAGDGLVSVTTFDTEEFCVSTWSTTHGATSGTAGSAGTTMQALARDSVVVFNCISDITRAFLPFDTSALPTNSSISVATLNVYITAKSNGTNDGNDLLTVIRTSQATHSSLTGTDYDNVGTTEGIDTGQRKDITSISTSAYLSFSLNSTGFGWIAKNAQASNCSGTAGITCLGIREYHDVIDSPPDAVNSVTISTSEETGTTQDPYLEVTYSVPASAVQSGMRVGSGGSLKVTSGGIKIR